MKVALSSLCPVLNHSPIMIAFEKLFSCLFLRKSLKSVHIFGILQLRSKVKVPYERRYQKPLEKKYSFMHNSSKFFRSSVTSQKQACFFLVCLCWSAIYEFELGLSFCELGTFCPFVLSIMPMFQSNFWYFFLPRGVSELALS